MLPNYFFVATGSDLYGSKYCVPKERLASPFQLMDVEKIKGTLLSKGKGGNFKGLTSKVSISKILILLSKVGLMLTCQMIPAGSRIPKETMIDAGLYQPYKGGYRSFP